MKKQNIIGIIPARIGSKRLPNKMLLPIEGKPLIQWTYENALKCRLLDSLIIATDDLNIFQAAKKFDAEVMMTSDSHCSGSDRCAEVIEKHPKAKNCDIILNIQGDEPEIDPTVLEKILFSLVNDTEADVATACVRIRDAKTATNPSNVKCVFNQRNHALYFSRAMIPFGKTGEFNPEIAYYKHFGIYAFRKKCLLHYSRMPATPLQKAEDLEQLKLLELGYQIYVLEVETDSLGIDTQEDLEKFINKRSFQ